MTDRPAPAQAEMSGGIRTLLREGVVEGRRDVLIVKRRLDRLLATRPARAWRHFLRSDGFLLSAGVSYQALFALSAIVYLVFVLVGLWLGANPTAVGDLIDVVNSYIPGLISRGGIVTPNQVQQIADGSRGALTVTGAIALVAAVWTAVAWVTYSRRAVRHMFALEPEPRSYLGLKLRDLVAALLFGTALVLGGVLSSFGEIVHTLVSAVLHRRPEAGVEENGFRAVSIAVTFVIDTVALATMFRFLTGTRPAFGPLASGALLGGAALAALQVGAGALLSRAPIDPLLATFAVFIGLLLWFRAVGVVVVASAAWVAVASADRVVAGAAPASETASH